MVAKSKPATYDDVLAAPEHMVAEVVNGELVLSPRPAYRHGRTTTRLVSGLDRFDRDPDGDDPGGWQIIVEPELHLVHHVLVPDVAGWRRERMPELPDVAFTSLAPDWVCEVASPSTQRHDRIVKSAIYLEAGVRWLWIVTPVDERIEVFEAMPDGTRWSLVTTAIGPEARRLPPFDAADLDVARLWSMR